MARGRVRGASPGRKQGLAKRERERERERRKYRVTHRIVRLVGLTFYLDCFKRRRRQWGAVTKVGGRLPMLEKNFTPKLQMIFSDI